MKTHYVFRLLVIATFVAWTATTWAAGPRVVLVHGGPGDSLSSHLIDELLASGFVLEVVPAAAEELSGLGDSRNARAVLRVNSPYRTVHIWLEGKSAPIRIEDPMGVTTDSASLALRAVEELRGQLLTAELPLPDVDRALNTPPNLPDQPSLVPPVPVDPHSVAAPMDPLDPRRQKTKSAIVTHSGQFWLQVMPSAMIHPGSGGITAGGAALIGARWMGSPRIGGDLAAIAPIIPASVGSPTGSVRIAASALFAGIWANLFQPVSSLTFGAGAGIGGGLFNHYGQPQTAGVEARDGTVSYFLPYLRSGLAWSATNSLSLRADILGAVATPRPVLRLPGRTTDVHFGQPMLTIGLGLDIKLR